VNLFKSIAAVIVLALVPAASYAAKQTTTTVQTHTESYSKNTSKVVADPMAGFYVAGQLGYNDPNGDFQNKNIAYAGEFGYRFNPNFRLEGEISYRANDLDGIAGISGINRLTDYMVNAWYDFANSTRFTPYVGGGIGYARDKGIANVPALGFTTSAGDDAFVYQLGAGVAYKLCNHWALTADYRYINTNNFSDIGEIIASEYRAGVRYSF
jgi:opacity protein-like surface antigen